MAFALLEALLASRIRLPRDQTTRLPRGAKKAGKPHTEAMLATVKEIAGLPGIADVQQTGRVPKGFYKLVETFVSQYDAYASAVEPFLPEGRSPAGQGAGCAACYASPMGVHTIEALHLYRQLRTRKDFPATAERIAKGGEQQFADITAQAGDVDPEKIQMGGRAVQRGRIAYARRKIPCEFLDEEKQRCRIAAQRPIVCRMHSLGGDPQDNDPGNPNWPRSAKAWNVRVPVRVQVALSQLDKRMMLGQTPFFGAGLLQLAQLAQGQLIHEVGEAPQRMAQDGTIAGKANRNRSQAKKFQKKKKRR